MELLRELLQTLGATLQDVLPIVVVIFGFQSLVIRRPITHLPRVITGFVLVIVGLTFFLVGLDYALFPLGRLMARQLADPSFTGALSHSAHWGDYAWVYVFGAALGFAATIAEPALLAVALKAHEVSGGAVGVTGLRIAVAIGAATGIALGTFRIVSGIPLQYFLFGGYVVVVAQTWFAPRSIIGLAYDSGGVTTSTVTVPLVTALGLGLASVVPGRSALLDGFGLIALTVLFPIIAVMSYAQLSAWRARRRQAKGG